MFFHQTRRLLTSVIISACSKSTPFCSARRNSIFAARTSLLRSVAVFYPHRYQAVEKKNLTVLQHQYNSTAFTVDKESNEEFNKMAPRFERDDYKKDSYHGVKRTGTEFKRPSGRDGRDAGGFRGGAGGGSRFGGSGGGRDKWTMESKQLSKINWSKMQLVPFKKDFYREHSAIKNRSQRDIDRFLEKHDITLVGQCPKPITEFNEIDIPDYVMNEIEKQGFQKPTPIQAQGWPIALSGLNMVGVAKTGSGF